MFAEQNAVVIPSAFRRVVRWCGLSVWKAPHEPAFSVNEEGAQTSGPIGVALLTRGLLVKELNSLFSFSDCLLYTE